MTTSERAKWLAFIRMYIADATVDYIGKWRGRLPGERELTALECDESHDVASGRAKGDESQ